MQNKITKVWLGMGLELTAFKVSVYLMFNHKGHVATNISKNDFLIWEQQSSPRLSFWVQLYFILRITILNPLTEFCCGMGHKLDWSRVFPPTVLFKHVTTPGNTAEANSISIWVD